MNGERALATLVYNPADKVLAPARNSRTPALTTKPTSPNAGLSA
jgi:hypothetical protein